MSNNNVQSSVSKSGRSKDVRRIYHGDTKAEVNGDKPRPPMRQWARRFISIARIGTVGDGQAEKVALVNAWLFAK